MDRWVDGWMNDGLSKRQKCWHQISLSILEQQILYILVTILKKQKNLNWWGRLISYKKKDF